MKRLYIPLIGWLVCIILIYLAGLVGEYMNCRASHRTGVQLNTDRQTVKESCLRNINPFLL